MKAKYLQDLAAILDQDEMFGIVSNGKVIMQPSVADGEKYYYIHFDVSPQKLLEKMYITLENYNGQEACKENSNG